MTSLLNLFVFIFLLVNIPAQAKLMSEYTEKTGKLTLLESRKKEFEEARNSKLKAIKHSKDENEQKKLYEEALKDQDELNKVVREYNTIRRELKYKFPKKNDQTMRRYLPMREVSLEEVATQTGIDGILDRVKKKIDKKYKKFTLSEKGKLEDPKKKEHKKIENEKIVLER